MSYLILGGLMLAAGFVLGYRVGSGSWLPEVSFDL